VEAKKLIAGLIVLALLLPLFQVASAQPPAEVKPRQKTIAILEQGQSKAWQEAARFLDWELQWFDGAKWVTTPGLKVVYEYPEPSKAKVTLVFTAPHHGDYRVVFTVNKAARKYVKPGKHRFELFYDDFNMVWDWSDAVRAPGLRFSHTLEKGVFRFEIRRDNVPLGATVEIDPTISVLPAGIASFQEYRRQVWNVNGSYVAFWLKSGQPYYSLSSNKVNWSSPAAIGAQGAWDVCSNGTHVFLAGCDASTGDDPWLYVYKVQGGSLAVVYSDNQLWDEAGDIDRMVVRAVNSSAVWLAYSDGGDDAWVAKGSIGAGGWTTAGGFPKQILNEDNNIYLNIIVNGTGLEARVAVLDSIDDDLRIYKVDSAGTATLEHTNTDAAAGENLNSLYDPIHKYYYLVHGTDFYNSTGAGTWTHHDNLLS